MLTTDEGRRMLAENLRREAEVPADRYAPWQPAELLARSERQALAARLLHRGGVFPGAGTRCLEVGYGRLGWLADLVGWGVPEDGLHGMELDPRRAAEARRALPAAELRTGDAGALPWSGGHFGLVVASTVFTSILDDEVRRRVAGEIVRVLAPGGALLWYDFRFDNPRNPNVRGIGRRELRELFPDLRGDVRSTTLAPPLARRLGFSRLATLLTGLPFLRTHLLAVLVKPAPTEAERVAAALDGDGEALAVLAREDGEGGRVARRQRAGSALALRAGAAGLAAPAWRRDLVAVAALGMQLREALPRVAEVLAGAGVAWVPLKGTDLATRIYDPPEERPTSDLDVLIAEADVPRAREALAKAGWQGLYRTPQADRFLAEEGYAWLAGDGRGTLLELHFRLWGLVAEEIAGELLERAVPDPDLPPGGHRLPLADAYVLAAVHAWLAPRPRAIASWWDLARIADQAGPESAESLAGEVGDLARRWDLELLVGLSARVSARAWGRPACRRLAGELVAGWRTAERWLTAGREPVELSLGRLVLARLLARRRSRNGWRGAWRRAWSHPGIVERGTPEEWPWLRRRLWFQLGAWGLRR